MACHTSFVISTFLLVIMTLFVQSVPIEKTKKIVETPSIETKQIIKQHLPKLVASVGTSSTITTTTTRSTTTISPSTSTGKLDNKKKRFIDDEQLDGISSSESNENDFNNKITHVLHPKIQETTAKLHDNADKPVDTDDSKVFSDIQMTPNDLTDIVRRRRDIKLNLESNRRRKRALLPYDIYDTDSFYDPYADLLEGQQYVRPARSFAPIYWYPSAYERNIRSALAPPSFYEISERPNSYSSNFDLDENLEIPSLLIDDDEGDDDDDYEFNRYPILSHLSNNLFDNLQLQQQYNTDDLPTDEDLEQNLNDDDDEEQFRSYYQTERPYNTRYGSIDTYF